MNDLIAYVEALTLFQGRHAGEKFKMLPWQTKWLRGAFRPRVTTSALSLARAAGKTTLISAVGCAALDGPIAQPHAETIIAASSFGQGQIAFRSILAFMRDKIELDRNQWRVEDNSNRCQITYLPTMSSVRCLGSDSRRMHGLQPSLLILDELSSWENTKIDASLSALTTSLGKVANSRMIAISTRPADSRHPFQRMLDGGADFSVTYAADMDADPFSPATWRKANPSLRYMPDLMDVIRKEAALARKDSTLLSAFRALRLNQGVSDVTESFVFDPSKWEELEGDAPMVGSPVFGVDLGSNASQSAISSYWPASGRLDVLAAFPRTPSLADRGVSDAVGDLYTSCARRGELLQLGEKISDVGQLLTAAYERFGVPVAIAADRWRVSELEEKLLIGGFPGCPLIERGQGFKDGAEDIRAMREACLTGKVTPTKSLLLRSAIREARTISDAAANEKLSKGSQGGRRQKGRDDALAAAILAVAIGYREASAAPRELEYAIV